MHKEDAVKDLMERYVYAVTRKLPKKNREDIENELRGLIEDMLQGRCGELSSTEQDLRVVLAELGTPSELAEKYDPDGKKALIGPPYYSSYMLILKIVAPCVLGGITLASVLTGILEPSGQPWYLALGQWFAMLVNGCIMGFGIITIIFAIFEWRKVKFDSGDDGLSSLPPVPVKNEIIHKWEPIVGMVISVAFVIVFLAAPQIMGIFSGESGAMVPIFNVGYLRSRWWIVVLLAIIGIARESVAFVESRYTRRLAYTALAADLSSLALTFLLFASGDILNPAFGPAMYSLLGAEGEFIVNIVFASFNVFFLGVISFALLLDMGTTMYKGFKYDKA